MKLKNKKTGEIVIASITRAVSGIDFDCGATLSELNEKWEDYEEPKDISEIDIVLDAIGEYCNEHSYYSGDLEKIKILNIVEEKLKAWKRLKDRGFRFIGYGRYDVCGNRSPYISFVVPKFDDLFDDEELVADLNLLFGGEDE